MKILIASHRKSRIEKDGYIALVTVLIVGLVASTVMVSLIVLGLGYSRTGQTTVLSTQARQTADACAEYALLQIRNDSGYTVTNASLNINNISCVYSVTNLGGSNRQIDVVATANTVKRKLQIQISSLSPKIVISSWQEIP